MARFGVALLKPWFSPPEEKPSSLINNKSDKGVHLAT
jgi:hypothetical protein